MNILGFVVAIFTHSIQAMTMSLTVFLISIVQQTVGSQVPLNQVKVGILAVTSLGHCPGLKNAVIAFNIKILSSELVKSWKSERSVNSQLDTSSALRWSTLSGVKGLFSVMSSGLTETCLVF